MKNMLIAIDYHPTAQIVAEKGYAFGKAFGAKITLIHVLGQSKYYAAPAYDPIMGFQGYAADDFAVPDVMDKLTNASYSYLENIKEHLGDSTIESVVKDGNVVDTILETAGQVNADVIVMGAHSHSWLEEMIMGSVTEKLIKHSKTPVLIVPTKK